MCDNIVDYSNNHNYNYNYNYNYDYKYNQKNIAVTNYILFFKWMKKTWCDLFIIYHCSVMKSICYILPCNTKNI